MDSFLSTSFQQLPTIHYSFCLVVLLQNVLMVKEVPQPTTRSCGEVVTNSLCWSQWRRRYFWNETLNNVSIECREDVLVLHLYEFFLERRDKVSRGRSDVP